MLPIKFDSLNMVFRDPESYEILSLPRNENKYFHNVRNQENFRNAQEYALEIFRNAIESIKSSCFYCGEYDTSVIPAFLHDGSGSNLWMFNDARCSIVLCYECNRHYGKGNVKYIKRFESIRSFNLKKILTFQPEILIPTLEPVHLHFEYPSSGYLVPKTLRAERTIDLFALNRHQLVDRRLKGIIKYNARGFLHASNKIKGVDGDFIFESMIMDYPVDVLFSFDDLNQINLNDSKAILSKIHKKYSLYPEVLDSKIPYKNETFTLVNESNRKVFNRFSGVEFIEFYGVRDFIGNQRISFNGKSSIIIVGENGVGKSTLLELIKRTLKVGYKKNVMDLSNTFNAGYFIKFTNDPALYHQHNKCRALQTKEHCHLVHVTDARSSSKGSKYLTDFLNVNDKNADVVDWTLKQIMNLLDFSNDITLEYKNMNIIIQSSVGSKYLNELSSGYNSILSIFGLVLNNFSMRYQNVNVSEIYHFLSTTFVLIDEVELHLHPKFKRNIISTLKKSFPEVRFIFTTHDPMVLSSSEKDDIVLLIEREVNGNGVTIRKNLPDHSELTTEQILSSPIFGLRSFSYDDAEDTIENYYEALNNENKEEALQLRKKLGRLGYFGKTYRDLIAFSAVDKYLSRFKSPDFDAIVNLLDEVDKND